MNGVSELTFEHAGTVETMVPREVALNAFCIRDAYRELLGARGRLLWFKFKISSLGSGF